MQKQPVRPHINIGLSLVVRSRTNGGVATSWEQRLQLNGRQLNLHIGTYPAVTLAEAKAEALRNANFVADEQDPRDMGQ